MNKTLTCTLALAILSVGALPMIASAQQLYTISPNQKNVWTPNGWAYPNSNYSYTATPSTQSLAYPVQSVPYTYLSSCPTASLPPMYYYNTSFASPPYAAVWDGGYTTSAETYSHPNISQSYSLWFR